MRHYSALRLFLIMTLSGFSLLLSRELGAFERTFPVSDNPQLEIETRSGDIEIIGGPYQDVSIQGQIRSQNGSDWFGMDKSDVQSILDNPPIFAEGDVIRIEKVSREFSNRVRVDYTLHVPTETLVKASTGSGDVQLNNLSRFAYAATGSGNIHLRNQSRGAEVSTGSGDIYGEKVDGSISFSTGSGDIDVQEISGKVAAKTGSGEIYLVFSGNGEAEANTGSGDIRIESIMGRVDAGTGSGDIEVAGYPQTDWYLETGSGDIDLHFAGEAGFEVDARTTSGDISTQYEILVSGSFGRNRLHGKVNDGGPKIVLRTTSGDISLD